MNTSNTTNSNQKSKNVFLKTVSVFFAIFLFVLIPLYNAVAASTSFNVSVGTSCNLKFDVGIDKDTYWKGQKVVATGSMTATGDCISGISSNKLYDWGLKASTDPVAGSNPSGYYESGSSLYTKSLFSAMGGSKDGSVSFDIDPNPPYQITFLGKGVTYSDSPGYGSSISLPFTVKETSMALFPGGYPVPTSYPSGSTVVLNWMMNPTFDFFGPSIVSCTPSEANGFSSAASGSFTTPALYATKTFNISCLDSYGHTATGSTTIVIDAPAPAPVVTVIADSNSVKYGNNTIIRWSVTNNPTSCTGTWTGKDTNGNTSGSFAASTSPTGNYYTTPNLAATTTFSVSCSN